MMRVPAAIAFCLLASTAGANAGSGFFQGGFAEGAAQSEQLALQRRALDLDARDGGSR